MNFMSGDMQLVLAQDRMSRLRAEAERHRMSRIAKGRRLGATDRMSQSLDRGFASIRESFTIDRRPRIPAI
jgi:YD repeat-containing protein